MKGFKSKYGPWAVVTGASSGMGKEYARILAELGLNVVIAARRQSRLKALADELINNFSIMAEIISADLASDEGINQLLQKTANLDVGLLVNNAGREDSGAFINIPLSEALGSLNLNCRTPLILTYHFAQQFQQRKKAGIIIMSSLVAYQGVPYVSNYAATKAYDLIFAESLGAELKIFGVDVLAVSPGFTTTEMGSDWDFSGLPIKPLEAKFVVRKAIEAMGKKSVIVPGLMNWILYITGKYLQTRGLNTLSFGWIFRRVLRSKLNNTQ